MSWISSRSERAITVYNIGSSLIQDSTVPSDTSSANPSFTVNILVTPTPAPSAPTLDVGRPSGWVAAGLLILLLAIMIYQSLKNLLKKIFRRKKAG
jgi:hypothetical protein